MSKFPEKRTLSQPVELTEGQIDSVYGGSSQGLDVSVPSQASNGVYHASNSSSSIGISYIPTTDHDVFLSNVRGGNIGNTYRRP